MTIRRLFALPLLLILVAGTAAAQRHPNYIEGFSPDGVYKSGEIDQINIFNGGVVMAVPIGQRYAVDGQLSYGLTLYFTGRVWHLFERCQMVEPYDCFTWAVQNGRSNAGNGWLLSLGRLIPPMTGTNGTSFYMYESPAGLESLFHTTLHPGDSVTLGVFYSRDGTYLRLKDLGNGFHEMELPDDTIHRFESSSGRLTQMRDRSSNWVNVTYPDSLTTQLSDKHGRNHFIRFRTSARSTVDRVDLQVIGGTTTSYLFQYTDLLIERSAEDDDPISSATLTVTHLTKLTLPDGSAFEVSYLTSNATFDGHVVPQSGYPFRVKLPTLGAVKYLLPSGLGTGVAGVRTRTLENQSGTAAGTWQYATVKDSLGRELKNTITTPRGDRTEHFFSVHNSTPISGWTQGDYGIPFTRNVTDGTSPGRFLSTRTYQGASTLARTGFVRYERDGPCPSIECASDGNRRIVSTRTTYNDDGSRYAITDYSGFDGLGHYRQATTAGNFDSGNVRTTFTNYNPTLGTYSLNADGTRAPGYTMMSASHPWVINTYSDQSATENGITSQSLFCWDSFKGLLTRGRIMSGTTPAASDVVKINAYNSIGNLINEYLYGGDVQSLPTTNLCATTFTGHQSAMAHTWQYGTLKTSRYLDGGGTALSFFSVDRDIDLSTGLVTRSRDSAGLATDYLYDNMGRRTWVRPVSSSSEPCGSVTDSDRWTETIYSRATSATSLARVDVYERRNKCTTSFVTRHFYRYDAFGRLEIDQMYLPTNEFGMRIIQYDNMGWKASVSERKLSTVPADKTTTYTYDRFGRVTLVVPPDGTAHQVNYAYQGDRIVQRTARIMLPAGETAVTTTETYDRQGPALAGERALRRQRSSRRDHLRLRRRQPPLAGLDDRRGGDPDADLHVRPARLSHLGGAPGEIDLVLRIRCDRQRDEAPERSSERAVRSHLHL
jgi:YD repeat-containing protein